MGCIHFNRGRIHHPEYAIPLLETFILLSVSPELLLLESKFMKNSTIQECLAEALGVLSRQAQLKHYIAPPCTI